MFSGIQDWLTNKALGKAVAVIAKAAASYFMAHSGVLDSFGVSAQVNPDALALGILGALSWAWHKISPTPAAGK